MKTKQKNFRRKDERVFGMSPVIIFYTRFVTSLIIASIVAFLTRNVLFFFFSFFSILGFLIVYSILRKKMKKAAEVKKMEESFPDFIELMASNLRAGMTIDRALLLSSRKEFAPLDREILNLGKTIMTGKDLNSALLEMSERIGSEKIRKTILLINSGIKAGGNISVLLEETAAHMRERDFVEKRAASNVLMYIIFIFFAVAAGAPILFGLSSVLVEVLTNLMANMPQQQTNLNLPFTLTKITVSVDFIIYFSMFFLVVIDVLASMILGLVSKGSEKEGLRYVLPLIAISLTVFFTSRIFLMKYFGSFIGGG